MDLYRQAKEIAKNATPSLITIDKYQRLYQRGRLRKLLYDVKSFMQWYMLQVLSVGPIPSHAAFIMDGNRRYAKKHNMEVSAGHRAGFTALVHLLKFCYLLKIKYVTVYAFSIDNLKRSADEVNSLMKLLREGIDDLLREDSIVNQFGIRICFIGNLQLVEKTLRLAAENAMKVTACNTNAVLLVCMAYTSTDEISHGVLESCKSRLDNKYFGSHHTGENFEKREDCSAVHLSDVEKHVYMSVVPDPDIVIRSSGEFRLSNFLLWQSADSLLTAPQALWPEMGFKELYWAIIEYQRSYSYLAKKKKQA